MLAATNFAPRLLSDTPLAHVAQAKILDGLYLVAFGAHPIEHAVPVIMRVDGDFQAVLLGRPCATRHDCLLLENLVTDAPFKLGNVVDVIKDIKRFT